VEEFKAMKVRFGENPISKALKCIKQTEQLQLHF